MSNTDEFYQELADLFHHDSVEELYKEEIEAGSLALLILPGRCFCTIRNNKELRARWLDLTHDLWDTLSHEQITTLLDAFLYRMENDYRLFHLSKDEPHTD